MSRSSLSVLSDDRPMPNTSPGPSAGDREAGVVVDELEDHEFAAPAQHIFGKDAREILSAAETRGSRRGDELLGARAGVPRRSTANRTTSVIDRCHRDSIPHVSHVASHSSDPTKMGFTASAIVKVLNRVGVKTRRPAAKGRNTGGGPHAGDDEPARPRGPS